MLRQDLETDASESLTAGSKKKAGKFKTFEKDCETLLTIN